MSGEAPDITDAIDAIMLTEDHVRRLMVTQAGLENLVIALLFIIAGLCIINIAFYVRMALFMREAKLPESEEDDALYNSRLPWSDSTPSVHGFRR